jgi:zinc/manganese transport system substrate-binding protein
MVVCASISCTGGTLRVKRFIILLLCFLPFAAQAEPLKVVVTFSILSDITHEIAGSYADVTSLVGPDGDVHAYEPTPADVRAVAGADIVIANGLGLEGWLGRLTQAAGFHGLIVVASGGVRPLMTAGAPDPHAWQNIKNGKRYVANIEAALMEADPEHAATYKVRAQRYLQKLSALDDSVRAQLATLPQEKRRAITSHDAMRYFADAYGVSFIAPLGLATSGDVSAGAMAKIVDEIRAKHVRAVFLENMADPRLMRQLVADGGAVIGGMLYSDALSHAEGEAPSYIEMFNHNVTVMVAAMSKN